MKVDVLRSKILDLIEESVESGETSKDESIGALARIIAVLLIEDLGVKTY